MKRKTVTAFLMSLCLAVGVPGTASASDIQSLAVEAEPQRTEGDTAADDQKAEEPDSAGTKETEKKPDTVQTQSADQELQELEACVEAAVKETDVDLASTVLQEFLRASDAYDALPDEKKKEVSEKTRNDIETVRKRIATKVHTDGAVTADSPKWYVKTETSDYPDTAAVLSAAQKAYPGCSPQIVYGKAITYTDIRTGEAYTQKEQIEMTVAVPDGYDALTNPKIVRYENGELIELSPERTDDGFLIRRARYVDNVFILDAPILLTGLSLDSELGVNVGQKFTLKATPVPATVTQKYQLSWVSSDPSVVSVDENGTVTAHKEGSAVVTVSVKDQPQIQASCQVKAVQGAHALSVSVAKVLEETRGYMQSVDKNPTLGSEWFALGLARSGVKTDSTYFKTYYNHIANYLKEHNGKLTSGVKYTEYSKMTLVMTALGKDARNIDGYNLLEPLADFNTVVEQGTNGPIWALIAVNSHPEYEIPKVSSVKVQTTKQKLIDCILDRETKQGGWSMTGDAPDPDLTGMALTALAPYYQVKGYDEVTAAVDRALTVLSLLQNKNGGYSTMGVETSESAAQVLTALCALGIDPMQDERFVKGGNWIVENLLSYHISGSGFMHVKAGAANNGGGAAGTVNGMATEQAYYALTAYQRLLEQKSALYDMSDITLAKGAAGDGRGTGLEEQEKNSTTDDSKKDTGKKDDTKKDTKKDDTKNKKTTKKKLTYKGKKLTLSSGSGKKLTLSGNSGEKLTLSEGSSGADGEETAGWSFEPEEYVEDGEESRKLTLSDALSEDADEEETDVSAADSKTKETVSDDTGDTQMEAKQGTVSATKEAIRRHPVAVFAGGVVAGALVCIGGVWLYLRKKRKNG